MQTVMMVILFLFAFSTPCLAGAGGCDDSRISKVLSYSQSQIINFSRSEAQAFLGDLKAECGCVAERSNSPSQSTNEDKYILGRCSQQLNSFQLFLDKHKEGIPPEESASNRLGLGCNRGALKRLLSYDERDIFRFSVREAKGYMQDLNEHCGCLIEKMRKSNPPDREDYETGQECSDRMKITLKLLGK